MDLTKLVKEAGANLAPAQRRPHDARWCHNLIQWNLPGHSEWHFVDVNKMWDFADGKAEVKRLNEMDKGEVNYRLVSVTEVK